MNMNMRSLVVLSFGNQAVNFDTIQAKIDPKVNQALPRNIVKRNNRWDGRIEKLM